MEIDKSRFINKDRARVVRLFLGIGTVAALAYGSTVQQIGEKVFLSSNPGGYSWEIDFTLETCFSKESPTLSEGYHKITIEDPYCPTIIEGQTKFDKPLTLFTNTLVGVKETK